MPDGLSDGLVGVSAIAAAAAGGIFFAFSNFIMIALARLPPAQGIMAMQQINSVVLNPWALGVMLGPAVLMAGLFIAASIDWVTASPAPLGIAAALYAIGCVTVTAAGNVPLNTALAKADPSSSEGQALWMHYCNRWTLFNTVRAVACLASAGVLWIGR